MEQTFHKQFTKKAIKVEENGLYKKKKKYNKKIIMTSNARTCAFRGTKLLYDGNHG